MANERKFHVVGHGLDNYAELVNFDEIVFARVGFRYKGDNCKDDLSGAWDHVVTLVLRNGAE
jgi:hypothetical protein